MTDFSKDVYKFKKTCLDINGMTRDEANAAFRKDFTFSELDSFFKEARKSYWNGTCVLEDWAYDLCSSVHLEFIGESDDGIEHGEMRAGRKVRHVRPMLSLGKVYDEESMFKWVDSVSRNDDEEFLVQPKYDGVSCHFEQFSGARRFSTRGDGFVGEDVTDICDSLCVVSTPKGDEFPNEFYGEIVISKSDFSGIFKGVLSSSGEPFKNPRNAVAGILGNDNPEYYRSQGAVIRLVDYDLYSFKLRKRDFRSGFGMVRGIISGLDYPMDGIVVKIADRDYSQELGFTSHHPKGQLALKFQNSRAWTVLRKIDFGMGKGQITATAVFDPVNMGGVTIERAVVPMASETLPSVMGGDFGVGTEILVERAGDVIPHVLEVKTKGEIISISDCPFCHHAIMVGPNSVTCTNDGCRAKAIRRLYCSLVTLGIKNIGVSTVDRLCDAMEWDGKGISLAAWMETAEAYGNGRDVFSGKRGTVPKSVMDRILEETKKISTTDREKFIAAMNIPGVGISVGRELSKIGPVRKIMDMEADELCSAKGVSGVLAERIHDFFADGRPETIRTLSCFRFLEEMPSAAVASQGERRTVCFTGAMRFKRSEMSRIASLMGLVPVSGVTRDTDILVIADSSDESSSKCVKARRYGVRIVREDDFIGGRF